MVIRRTWPASMQLVALPAFQLELHCSVPFIIARVTISCALCDATLLTRPSLAIYECIYDGWVTREHVYQPPCSGATPPDNIVAPDPRYHGLQTARDQVALHCLYWDCLSPGWIVYPCHSRLVSVQVATTDLSKSTDCRLTARKGTIDQLT